MFSEKLFEILKRQGISFLLLGIAVWYFYTENKELRGELKDLQSDVIRNYQNDNAKMREAIDRNTFVIQSLLKRH
jgi:hypothetical protein